MSIKANFIDDNIYYSNDLNRQFYALIEKNGLLREGVDFIVSPTSPISLNVIVAEGSAYINGIFIHSDSKVEVEIPRNDGEFDDRIDSVVLRLNPVSGEVEIKNLIGEIGEAPELSPYDLKICDIRVSPTTSDNGLLTTSDKITMTSDYIFLTEKEIYDILNEL